MKKLVPFSVAAAELLCSFSPATGDKSTTVYFIIGGIVIVIIIVAFVLGRRKYK